MARLGLSLLAALKILLLTCIFCEMIVMIFTHYATTGSAFAEITMTALVRTSSHKFHAPATTPIFLVGFLLTLCGAYVRWSSYRALGPLFTFELSIRDQHKLITTGPYSIVRHPSYTGMLLFFPGSWIHECGWLDLLPIKISAVLVTVVQATFILLMPIRLGIEDEMMRKEFGQQWEEWAKKVPYKLVPGIF
ncbi:hypothetical protein BT96DRAFT_924090 [Gymnopus androsaceus JB14]|uniref:Protein-S-isoprenylcysteine O-methyltransferase n=1 Tax=Gymnopus androsaceus JB14 TaxID=1447944 RepID=A0A6A4H6E6_9AGAR|nr:hypothetical protein BT96DRAFT_924090 [Gymnopus androsaceus JB14]